MTITFSTRLLAAFLTAAVFLAVGCGDGEGESPSASTPDSETTATSASGSPTATTPTEAQTPSAIATPSPGAESEAPHAEPIQLDFGVESLAENVLVQVLQPQETLQLDSDELAKTAGITPPPCLEGGRWNRMFYLNWQVRDPYPPTDVDIVVYWTRTLERMTAEGPSGRASTHCGEFLVTNNSDMSVTVEIRYAIGELTDIVLTPIPGS